MLFYVNADNIKIGDVAVIEINLCIMRTKSNLTCDIICVGADEYLK